MQKIFFVFASVLMATAGLLEARVQLGIDVLEAHDFSILNGKRVGLITNQTGVNSRGVKTRQVLHRAKSVNLVALYTPEHGLDGTERAGVHVSTRKDPLTGLTAYSLYGSTRKPTPTMLKGVDALVFDMQDIGSRSYTYVSTMIKGMEAAAENGIEFIVLDRPNPLGGLRIEGPPMEPKWISFIGQVPVPYVHGMTAGEIARMANGMGWIRPKCKLSVVEMRGWDRRMLWKDTGLKWVKPSPNIPHPLSPMYYVATGLVGELSGVNVGCGGETPFEVIGAPGIDPEAFTAQMRSLGLPGVSFTEFSQGKTGGSRLRIDPQADVNLTALNIHMLAAMHKPSNLFARSKGGPLDLFYKAYGSNTIRQQIEDNVPVNKIVSGWEASVARFAVQRKPFLLY